MCLLLQHLCPPVSRGHSIRVWGSPLPFSDTAVSLGQDLHLCKTTFREQRHFERSQVMLYATMARPAAEEAEPSASACSSGVRNSLQCKLNFQFDFLNFAFSCTHAHTHTHTHRTYNLPQLLTHSFCTTLIYLTPSSSPLPFWGVCACTHTCGHTFELSPRHQAPKNRMMPDPHHGFGFT